MSHPRFISLRFEYELPYDPSIELVVRLYCLRKGYNLIDNVGFKDFRPVEEDIDHSRIAFHGR